MRKLFLCFFVFAFLCSCAQEMQKEKIPFIFTPERKLMSIPVTIQGVAGNFLFDTGADFLCMDTIFATKIAPYDSISDQFSTYNKGAFFDDSSKFSINVYKGLLKVGIGNHCFEQKYFSVGDYCKGLILPEFDGLFGLEGFIDSPYVWELNFEKNYINITAADNFHLDGDFLTLPLKWNKGKTFTTLPITIRIKQGVEVKSEKDFLIDTGSITDVLFIHDTEESQKLDTQKDSAYWLPERHFWDAEMTVCNRVKLDAARVYVYDMSYTGAFKGILGLNFLKRFNVYFDLKNNQLYLKPIKTFERITQGKKPWGKFSSSQKNGKDIIDRICDYKDNPAIKAGFQIGDEIISINGKLNSEYSEEDWEKLSKEEIWNYVIKRDGKLLNLILHRNLDKQIED